MPKGRKSLHEKKKKPISLLLTLNTNNGQITWDPEHFRSSIINPIIQEIHTLIEIFNPRHQRFQGEMPFFVPHMRDKIVMKIIRENLKLFTHNYLSN